MSFGFLIETATVFTGVGEFTDMQVADNAESPVTPIPSNLILKGSATIPASADGATSGTQGIYRHE